MITLIIEEKDNEEVSFKFNGINTATNMEKVVLSSILSVMNDDFEVDKSATKITTAKQQEQEDGN